MLGWSLRTFDRRLGQGRELLKARLVRRGVGALGLGLSVFGSDGLTAGVPDRLVGAACGERAIVPPSVQSLMVYPPSGTLFKLALGVVVALGGLAAVSGFGGNPPATKPADGPPPKVEDTGPLEEPMPDGALRRFGSTRFRYPGGNAHAAMSRDGRRVAIGGYGVVLVYDTATGQRVRTIDHCGMTNSVGRLPALAFSPDGTLLAHLVRDGKTVARIWDLASGKEVLAVTGLRPDPEDAHRFSGFGPAQVFDNFTGLHFTGDGKGIAIVGDHRVHLRNARTGEAIAIYNVPAVESGSERVTLMAFTPDGKLYVGNRGADWQVGELATGKVMLRTTVNSVVRKERRWQYPFAAISPDGKLVAIPTENLDEVGLWDVPGRRLVKTLSDRTTKVRMMDHLAFSADGRQVFAGGENIVYRWDTATGSALPALVGNAGYGPPRTFTDETSRALVTVDDNGMIRRWDPATGRQLEAPHGYVPYTMTDLTWDGRYAVIADGSGRLDLWSLGDDRRYELSWAAATPPRDVRFSRSGKLLAAGFADGTVRVWETATRTEVRQFRANPDGAASSVEGLDWSPDESTLYVTTGLHGALAWNWRAVKLDWQQGTAHATKVRASRDGTLVAVLRTDDREIQILDARSGAVRATARMPADKDRFFAPHGIAFGPDSRVVYAGHYDGTLRVWDTATGQERAAFPSDGDVIWGIDVSRDGRHAVTGSSNGTVRVWELDTGKEVFRRTEPRSSSLRVTFAADGRSVFSAQQRAPILWSVVPTSAADRERLWADLAADPAAAYHAQWGLAAADGLAKFLRQKVGPKVPVSEGKRIVQLIADLDDGSFRRRESASRELAGLGRLADPAVRSALAGSPSAEQRQRLEGLAAGYPKEPSPAELRLRRATQALARSRDAGATALLTDWASGLEWAPLTEAARAALGGAR